MADSEIGLRKGNEYTEMVESLAVSSKRRRFSHELCSRKVSNAEDACMLLKPVVMMSASRPMYTKRYSYFDLGTGLSKVLYLPRKVLKIA